MYTEYIHGFHIGWEAHNRCVRLSWTTHGPLVSPGPAAARRATVGKPLGWRPSCPIIARNNNLTTSKQGRQLQASDATKMGRVRAFAHDISYHIASRGWYPVVLAHLTFQSLVNYIQRHIMLGTRNSVFSCCCFLHYCIGRMLSARGMRDGGRGVASFAERKPCWRYQHGCRDDHSSSNQRCRWLTLRDNLRAQVGPTDG